MDLKNYQRRVLDELSDYLDTLELIPHLSDAFTQYWANKGADTNKIESYKNNVPGVPHVCAKVPTAGGKTYIAVHAIDTIFSALTRHNPQRAKFVVWLTPSLTILEQTVKNLSDPEHPYRKKLDQLLRHRVQVYEKQDLLMGADFTPESAASQLSIVVMTFDSLRSRKKEDRKIYQENGYLARFTLDQPADDVNALLLDYDPSSLINVIRKLKPVVIVDESHNAETPLSVEMLQNLNPDFIYDLTATPRRNSNIISFVDALALKKQHMVKLPVIVANRASRSEAMESALILRNHLENIAKQDQKNGGKYIRPIILFQAQPQTDEDNTTFTKVKEKLISLKIPAEQIAIKTADINELKNVDLMSPDCPIRYIITVNALREGWDCPFAYILVSLANKTSAVDVEQIVGRILRVPYTRTHANELLNMAYVFTASARFLETLQSVVNGLNRAGFSEKDYRAFDMSAYAPNQETNQQAGFLFDLFDPSNQPAKEDEQQEQPEEKDTDTPDIPDDTLEDLDSLQDVTEHFHQQGKDNEEKKETTGASGDAFVDALTNAAHRQNEEFKQKADANKEEFPQELEDKMNLHRVKELFLPEIQALELPQFFLKVQIGGFFDDEDAFQLFEKEELLKDFKLAQADANIHFEDVESEMYRIDLEEIGKEEYAPKPFKINARDRERLNQHILSIPREGQIREVTARFASLIGNMYPITDLEIARYITRILQAMTPEQIRDCLERDYAYVRKIRDKINELALIHSEKVFSDWLDIERIVVQPNFKLKESITPSSNSVAIPNSLYRTEGSMSPFEHRVINDIANLESTLWWHRNLSRGKGFRINGFINHYPDFIIKTKRGHIIALETKGDDRDNTDSKLKLKLGKDWEAKAGSTYRYMMVFDNKPIDGAEKLADALRKLEQL